MSNESEITGRDLAYQLVVGLLLGASSKEPAAMKRLHQILIQRIHETAEQRFGQSEKAQLLVAEATATLDSIFSLASVVQDGM